MKKILLAFLILFGCATAEAQTTYRLMPVPHQQFLSNTGVVMTGGFLCTYASGTTTSQAAYSDTLGTTLPNPIRLNSAGRPQTGSSGSGTETGVYLSPSAYKINLYAAGTGNTCNGTAVGSLIWSQDKILAGSTLGASVQVVTFTSTPTFDTSLAGIFEITLTGNVTSSTLANAGNGSIIQMTICQDGTGSRTFAWPATVLTPPTIAPTASGCTSSSFFYDGTYWRPWSLNGTQTATGYYLSGNVVITGTTTTNTLSVTGAATEGSTVTGSIAVSGAATAGSLVVSGATTVGTFGATTITASSTTTLNSMLTMKEVTETLNIKTGATGTVTHDFTTGAIWYHSSVAANFTLNLTNVPVVANEALGITLIISQGGTGYYPNALQVNGGAVTIKWQAGLTPAPSTSKFDAVTFSLIYTGSTWYALGQLVNFN